MWFGGRDGMYLTGRPIKREIKNKKESRKTTVLPTHSGKLGEEPIWGEGRP